MICFSLEGKRRFSNIFINVALARFHHEADSDHIVAVKVETPGSYEFYVEYTGPENIGRVKCKSSGYFVVDPRLSIFKKGKQTVLPLDGITILTIIPKWMPVIDDWKPFFKSFSQTGYNMVHFAPINRRGISNSPYSINDQLDLADDLFSEPIPCVSEKFAQMSSLIQDIHREFSILSVTDIVWNHTSCDSEWLQLHPESGYNLETAPHLRPAFELDDSLLNFSEDLEKAKDNILLDEGDMARVLNMFQEQWFKPLRLFEFYVLDVKPLLAKFASLWKQRNPTNSIATDLQTIVSIMDSKERTAAYKSKILVDPKTYRRFSKTVDMQSAILLVEAICVTKNITLPDFQTAEFENILNDINLDFYQEYDQDCIVIMNQIRNRAKFLRLDEHGPRLGPISRTNPIVDTYFTRLPKNENTKKLHPDQMVLACNGWIWNADPLVNFAGPDSKSYLRREVIGWGDCVKLRYGERPVSCSSNCVKLNLTIAER